MYRNIEEIIGKRTCSSTGCLKTKEGSIIMDKEKILERWAEYIGELSEDNRKEHDVNCDEEKLCKFAHHER